MSAKDFLTDNKIGILQILTGNHQLVVEKCHEKGMITESHYINLRTTGSETEPVIQLINNIIGEGEQRCETFLDFLQTDEYLTDAFPQLKDTLLKYTPSLRKPVQESISTANAAQAEAIARSSFVLDEEEYYALTHKPRGWCVIINNENFGRTLGKRRGAQEDRKALAEVFTRLGFKVDIHDDLTADEIRTKLKIMARKNFMHQDALVVCVSSHGEKSIVYGSDENMVSLEELTQPFTSDRAPTLAGKPKLFFIEASQGDGYQRVAVPCHPEPRQGDLNIPRPETMTQTMHSTGSPPPKRKVTVAYHYKEDKQQTHLKEAPYALEPLVTVASDADFLMGMSTISGYMSFRNTSKGSYYMQELCRQLMKSGGSSEMDDILTILTRVNREINKLKFLDSYKQIPQPYYTLTKKLVLKFV